jgi:hypothetical protein
MPYVGNRPGLMRKRAALGAAGKIQTVVAECTPSTATGFGGAFRGARQQRTRLIFARWGKALCREWHACGMLRPAVPFALFNGPNDIARAPNGPTTAIIVAVVGCEEPSVRTECQPEGILKTPGNQL